MTGARRQLRTAHRGSFPRRGVGGDLPPDRMATDQTQRENKYESQTDRMLVQEYGYFRPIGDPSDAKEDVEDMAAADVAELRKITDELARRVNPGVRTDTRKV